MAHFIESLLQNRAHLTRSWSRRPSWTQSRKTSRSRSRSRRPSCIPSWRLLGKRSGMNLFAQIVSADVIVANVPLHTIFEHLRIQRFPSVDRHMHTSVAMAIRATFALKDQVIQCLPISFLGLNSELLDPFWHLLVEVHRKWTHGHGHGSRLTDSRDVEHCASLCCCCSTQRARARDLAKSSQVKSSQGAK